MKNLFITTGGHPFTIDDLQWLQTASLEVTQELSCLLAAPGGGNRLLAGGEIDTVTPTHRDVEGGWVCWDGELIKFNGASLIGAGYVVISKATVNIPPSKIYASGAVVFSYRETAGQLLLTPTLGNPAYFYLATAIRFGVGVWQTAALSNPDWLTYQPSPTLYFAPSFRRLNTGVVELRGHLEVGSVTAIATAFTLPPLFQPKRVVSFARSYSNNAGGYASCWVEVASNGDVNIFGVPTTLGYRLSLDGICFDVRS